MYVVCLCMFVCLFVLFVCLYACMYACLYVCTGPPAGGTELGLVWWLGAPVCFWLGLAAASQPAIQQAMHQVSKPGMPASQAASQRARQQASKPGTKPASQTASQQDKKSRLHVLHLTLITEPVLRGTDPLNMRVPMELQLVHAARCWTWAKRLRSDLRRSMAGFVAAGVVPSFVFLST